MEIRAATGDERGGTSKREEQRPRERIPDDQPAPHVEPRETHQTSEVPLGSGDRPVPPGSGGDSARVTSRPDPARKEEK